MLAESGNIGPPLWTDIIVPTVGWILYSARQRAVRREEPAAEAGSTAA